MGAFACAAALALTATSASASASLRVATTPSPAVVPPAQIHQLDFLLGDLHCVYNTGTDLKTHDRTILGGTYVQLDMHADRALGNKTINGRWILGWDAVRSQFVTFYYDDNLNQGTSTSPGWQNGTFTLTGEYVLAQIPVPLAVKDVFTPIDANHFTIQESAVVKGSWQLLDTQDCLRTPRR